MSNDDKRVPLEAIAAYFAIRAIFGRGRGDGNKPEHLSFTRVEHDIDGSFFNTFRALSGWNRLAIHTSKQLLRNLDPNQVAELKSLREDLRADFVNALRSGELQKLLSELDSTVLEIANEDADDGDHNLFFAVDSVHFVASGHAFVALRDAIAPRIIGDDDATLDARNRLATSIGDDAKRFEGVITAHVRNSDETPDGMLFLDDRLADDSQETGILSLDELFARHLESIGEHGKTAAAEVREKGRHRKAGARWVLWKQPDANDSLGSPWVEVLGRALWEDSLRAQIETERRKRERTPVGSALPVARFLSDVMQRGTVVKRDEERQIDWLLDREERPIAELESGTLVTGISRAALAELQKEAELLGSVEAHALRHYLLRQAREHHVNGGDFVIEIGGGLEGLARELGSTSKASPAKIHRVLDALRRLRRDYHGILLAGFVTYVLDVARGQRASVLRISIGDPLRPTFVHFLQSRLGATAPIAQEARMIVPDVGTPPLYGRANDWALQETAALETSILFRQRADELAERGAIHVARVEWERIAHRAGYARRYVGRTVDELLKHWVQNGEKNKAPAFLEHGSDWRFNFGSAHTEARTSLLEAGQRTLKGRKDGEASSKRRSRRAASARRQK